jgi:hypothetical protein
MLALVDKLVEDRLEDTEGARMLGKAADIRLWACSRLLGLLCTQSGRLALDKQSQLEATIELLPWLFETCQGQSVELCGFDCL